MHGPEIIGKGKSVVMLTTNDSLLIILRIHHKYTETNADPHNASRGLFFSHIGWVMVRKHPDVTKKGKTIDMSDLKADPIVMFQYK